MDQADAEACSSAMMLRIEGVRRICCLMARIGWCLAACVVANTSHVAWAEVAGSPITSSGLKTEVSDPIELNGGQVRYDITGGTRPGNGANLFHSFGDFSVPSNSIGNFVNDSGVATSNILARVTGGNPSNILGAITTAGFAEANLFLMNPAGIVFGPNASVNIGGAAHFSTADYLMLGPGERFAVSGGEADALLSSAEVSAFGFLKASPSAIVIDGSTLSVHDGKALSLVGGDVTVGSSLTATSGEIAVVSVASPGEVMFPSLNQAPNIEEVSFAKLGTISLVNGGELDVSGAAAGAIRIRGGKLVITNSTISADTGNAHGANPGIDIELAGSMAITSTDVPALTARTSGSGNAGKIRIISGSLDVDAKDSSSLLSIIDTHSSGAGKAGEVSIMTGALQVAGNPEELGFFIDSGTRGSGDGGRVQIEGTNVMLENTSIATGTRVASLLGEDGTGRGGEVSISAEILELSLSSIVTDSFSFTSFSGEAGKVRLLGVDVKFEDSFISAQGIDLGGDVSIVGGKLLADDFQIETLTINLGAGNVTVDGDDLQFRDGSSITTSTGGNGNAGSIKVTATTSLSLRDPSGTETPSGFFSNSLGILGSFGAAGDVMIEAPRLEMIGGARINTVTASSGRGGKVTINANESVSISGEIAGLDPVPLFSLGSLQPSGIFTSTTGGSCSGTCGNAGDVSIRTGSLTMGSGAQVNSGTSSSGRGGQISVNAAGSISLSGTLSDGSPAGMLSRTTGSGQGGSIELTAAQSLSMSGGSAITVDSTGSSNAGDITVTSGDTMRLEGSSITAEALQASGGNIKLNAPNQVLIENSTISTSVQGGPTTVGGNINIDPQFVILKKSKIIAQAFQGQGGNIDITTNVFLADANSVVDASSQFGVSGTVTIQSPISNLSGTLAPMPEAPLEAAALLRAACAARMQGGQTSSFVQAGRGGPASEPGGWLASPMPAAASPGVPASPSLAPGADGATVAVSGGDPTPNIRATRPVGPLTRLLLPSGNLVCSL